MSKLLIMIMVMSAALLLSGPGVWALEQTDSQFSPVTPPVAREGDFAVRLAATLGLGPDKGEVEAESLLTARGIAPRNGWIADYPVTPIVMEELRESVATAASTGSIALNETSASSAFDALASELGMAPDQATGDAYASAISDAVEPPPPETSYGEYPAYYDTYYTDGPPIYTYYAPPYQYYGLYDWVPWPFFYTGIHFSGFFILHDFDRHCNGNSRFLARGFWRGNRLNGRIVSNHHVDSVLGRTTRVRPAMAFRDATRTVSLGVGSRLPSGIGGSSIDSARRIRELGSSRESSRTALPNGLGRSDPFGRRALDRSQSGVRERGILGSTDFRDNVRSFSAPPGSRTPNGLSLGTVSRGNGVDPFSGGRIFRGSDGGHFRTFNSSVGGNGGSFRSFNSLRGSSASSFRSFGGGGSVRSFTSGGGGFSGRGGGGFSMRGGGGGRRGR